MAAILGRKNVSCPMRKKSQIAVNSGNTRRILVLADDPSGSIAVFGIKGVFEVVNQLILGQSAFRPYDFRIIEATGNPSSDGANKLHVSMGRILRNRCPIDTLIVSGSELARDENWEKCALALLRRLASKVGRLASTGTGVFVLAAASSLDRRRATTHWRWSGQLQEQYPVVQVDKDMLVTRDGNVWTSAGASASIDLALGLIEDDHGHEIALAVARQLLVPLRRLGGQRQFEAPIDAQVLSKKHLADIISFVRKNLLERIAVGNLAGHLGISERQLFRLVDREANMSPSTMIEAIRISVAQDYLEKTEFGLAEIVDACGFGSEETMRRAFLRRVGVTPGLYRGSFKKMQLAGASET